MDASKNSLDNVIRQKRKIQKIALLSAILVCFFASALIVANFRRNDLANRKIDELLLRHDQLKLDAQTSSDTQDKLNQSRAEVEELKKLLSTEKNTTLSLKGKLSAALKQIAETREGSPGSPNDSENSGAQPSQSPTGISNAVKDASIEQVPQGSGAETQIKEKTADSGTVNEPDSETPSSPSQP